MSTVASRRSFVKTSGLGVAGALSAPWIWANVGAAERSDGLLTSPVKLGVATYSLRQFDRLQAIAMLQELQVKFINIKSFHLPYELSATDRAMGIAEFTGAGFQVVGGGLIPLQKDDDDDMRFYFEYAKQCGFPLIVVGPTPATLDRMERFVKAYDIKVAIHNHGPEDPHFPAPADVLRHIEDMDPRVGLCVDVGHTARTGVDVVAAIADAGERLLDIHMKDLRDLRVKESQCAVGRGKMPVSAIFQQLMQMQYQGYVNLEYEIHPKNPLPGMIESLAYMRGVLAGLHNADSKS